MTSDFENPAAVTAKLHGPVTPGLRPAPGLGLTAASGPADHAGENASDVFSLVGNTPLLRLNRIARLQAGVELYAKAEWFNPGGSVKDRAALNIIREAERAGLMCRGKLLIDSTSGNTGIAYAMLCAARGYRLKLFVPDNVSLERKRTLHAYGAEVVYTDPLEGSDGAIRAVRELARQNAGQYFYANQYDNPSNWRAHYHSTASEVFNQTQGRITHFVAGLGTSGTFMGTSRRLKELNSAIRCISVQPDEPFHGLEGMKHMPTSIPPRIYDPALADGNLVVSTEEAQAMTLRLAREEGLLVGVSSGAALAAALRVAAELRHGVIVTIFCDGGDKYLSERFWDETADSPIFD
ncbi:MAG TPA: cysteine synthase family protein [Terriglobia bacterium]|nr:cysteine synthase family protein [Terriglobia bacterium]